MYSKCSLSALCKIGNNIDYLNFAFLLAPKFSFYCFWLVICQYFACRTFLHLLYSYLQKFTKNQCEKKVLNPRFISWSHIVTVSTKWWLNVFWKLKKLNKKRCIEAFSIQCDAFNELVLGYSPGDFRLWSVQRQEGKSMDDPRKSILVKIRGKSRMKRALC